MKQGWIIFFHVFHLCKRSKPPLIHVTFLHCNAQNMLSLFLTNQQTLLGRVYCQLKWANVTSVAKWIQLMFVTSRRLNSMSTSQWRILCSYQTLLGPVDIGEKLFLVYEEFPFPVNVDKKKAIRVLYMLYSTIWLCVWT